MSTTPEQRHRQSRSSSGRPVDPRTLPTDLPRGWLLTLQRHRRYGLSSGTAETERTTAKMLRDIAALRELRHLGTPPPPRA
ncbi:hypothetical protein ACFJGV_07805 [Cnuibacter sp. UC19_7]|uniref:hypothetical protein n=1 Tax=Cnuibacter sp. UC19_7 TaxID=3350166 RepID=UPI00366E958E